MNDGAAGRSKVVIVGAGIGGLSAHLAFAGAGFEVAHYERRSEQSAALTIILYAGKRIGERGGTGR